MTKAYGRKCCRAERDVQEARETEESTLQQLMVLDEEKRKQREYAAEQVRKVKVSVGHHLYFFAPYLFQ